MTTLEIPIQSTDRLMRRATLVGVLELACQELDLTPTQYAQANERYKNAGDWIATSDDPRLRSAVIYSQGSIALETAIRPLEGEEFDVDSVDHLPIVLPAT